MSFKAGSERYLKFLVGFAPVLLIHAVIPPLSVLLGNEKLILTSLPLRLSFIERHMIYSKAALRAGRWYTTLTYMLVHADYSHLANNMQCLVVTGPVAVESVGLIGALVVYAAAGIISALDPLNLFDVQVERRLSMFWTRAVTRYLQSARAWWGESSDVGGLFGALDTAAGVLSSTADRISARFVAAYAPPLAAERRLLALSLCKPCFFRAIGASGGVSAFMVLGACESVERLFEILTQPRAPVHLVCPLVAHSYAIARYFLTEAERVTSGTGKADVDHAAHLTGALVGLAAFAASRAWRSFWQKRRRHSNPPPSVRL